MSNKSSFDTSENLLELQTEVLKSYELAEAGTAARTTSLVVPASTNGQSLVLHPVEFERSKPKRLDAEGGERLIESLKMPDIKVAMHAYGDQFGVKYQDILSKTFGPATMKAASFGVAAKRWQDDLVAEVLMHGKDTTGAYVRLNYDGNPLFAQNRVIKGGTQSNLLTSTTVTFANLNTIQETFLGMKDAYGNPYPLELGGFIVPTSKKPELDALAEQERVYDGSNVQVSNNWRGKFGVVHLPELDSEPGVVYAFARDKTPFTMYTQMPPVLSGFDDWSHESVVKRLRAEFYWTAMGNLAAGPYQHLIRIEE